MPSNGWMPTSSLSQKSLLISRRRSKLYAILSLLSCTRLVVELPEVCQVVCPEVCLTWAELVVHLVLVRAVLDLPLKRLIKQSLDLILSLIYLGFKNVKIKSFLFSSIL